MISHRPSPLSRVGERLRELSTRDRRALIAGLAVVLPALVWIGVVQPWWSTLEELRAMTAIERELLTRERGLLEQAPALPQAVTATLADLARKESLLVESRNPALAEAAVTRVVQDKARESRALLLEARSVAGGLEDLPNGLVPIRLNVRIESDFEGILDFVHALEADPLLLRVFAFAIEPSDDGAMTLTATIEAYAARAPGSAPGRDAAPERDGSQATGSVT